MDLTPKALTVEVSHMLWSAWYLANSDSCSAAQVPLPTGAHVNVKEAMPLALISALAGAAAPAPATLAVPRQKQRGTVPAQATL